MAEEKILQLPRNLAEALAGTPLTYLVPTQSLVPHVQPIKITIQTPKDHTSTDYKDYVAFINELSDIDAKEFISSLGIDQGMEDTSIQFGVLKDTFSQQLASHTSDKTPSLFDGLDGLAAHIVKNVTLVDESELLSRSTVNPSATPNTTTTTTTTITSMDQQPTVTSFNTYHEPAAQSQSYTQPKSHPPTQPSSSQPHTQEKRHSQDNIGHDQSIKKRKSEIGVQHLQIETISLNQLVELVQNKIGLTDEQSEFESSDIWIELPNTDHILNDSTIDYIGALLLKLRGTTLVETISFEVLERIQQLMMKSILFASEIELSTAIQENDPNYKLALNALTATCTLLSVFNLQRKEKKLYLDDYLTDALTFLYRFVEDYVMKLTTADELKRLGSLSIVRNIIEQVCIYLTSNQANDTLITKLEYMAIMIFFHQADRYFLPFKWSSMKLLITIFEHIPDQRSFIIDEIITSMDRLPTHKVTSRQATLLDGVNVQLVTVLILNLINCLNLKSIPYSSEFTNPGKQLHAHEKAEKLKEDQRFFEDVKRVKKEREQLCASIASSLISKLINTPNANTKALFELFLQDLLAVVVLPNYTAAESILFEMTKYLMYNSENQPALVETHLIEMIGLVGSKMLEIKGLDEPPQNSSLDRTTDMVIMFKILRTQKNETVCRCSSDLFLAKWVDSLVSESHSADVFLDDATMSILNQILSSYFNGKDTNLFQSIDVSSKSTSLKELYDQCLLYSNFISLYQNFLNHLLTSVEHLKIKSRTRALKNLAQIISQDERFINVPQVKLALSNRISDPSALVRLAVLEIFQQCIKKKPYMIPDLYQTILLTNDKSLAVRKRSVELSRDVIEQSRDTEIQVYALEKILRRLEDDEESVLDLTKTILVGMFTIDPLFFLPNDMNNLKSVSGLCTLLLKLISRSSKNWELFESFLFESVIRLTDSNKNIHERLLSVCQTLVCVLFAIVISNIDNESSKKIVEQGLGLLSILSKSEKPFVSQEQLLSLQPYLTSESNADSTTFHTLVILRNTLSHTSSLREQFIVNAQSSLLKRLTKFNTKELDQAVPSVWILSEMKGDTSKIANAAASCLLLIRPYLDKALQDKLAETDPKVLRLLYLIGSFGRYCDLEKNRDVFMKQKKLSLKEKETILSLITKTILIFTKPKVHRQIRRVAVRNLIHVATSHSKLFMSEPVLKVMDQEFASDHSDFKAIMIQGLLEFLEKEEKYTQAKSRLKKNSDAIDVHVFQGSAKTFENDGICASLVQRYMEPVLGLCLDVDSDNSFLAVKYLRFIVNLGFANPRICIPTVIALQASPTPYIRMVGIELHKELHERNESLIDSSYISGIKEAVKYRMRLSGDGKAGEGHQFFRKFYGVIEESKTSRKRFLTQLVRSFKFNMETIQLTDAIFLREYVTFLCPSMLEYEFSSYDELFSLIEGIEFLLISYDNAIKLMIQQLQTPTAMNDSPPIEIDKLGTLSSVLLTLHQFIKCLRISYKIPHGMEKPSLKTQRAKIHEKTVLPMSYYFNGDGITSPVFEKLLLEIV